MHRFRRRLLGTGQRQRHGVVRAALVTICLSWALAGRAGVFIVTDYELAAGEFPRDGADQSVVFDINEDNFAVGVLLDAGVTPVVWVPEPCPPDCQPPVFSVVPLPTVAGTSDSVTAISNLGADGFVNVAGSRLDPATGQLTPIAHRFFNTNPGNVTTTLLPVPQGFSGGAALDVNRDGDVVGYLEQFPSGPRQAVFWDREVNAYTANPLDATEAVAISDDGPVAANTLPGARLFPDPANDVDDFVVLGAGLSDLTVHDISEVDRRSGIGALRVAGSTSEFLTLGPDFQEPVIFSDPINAPDTFVRAQSVPSATPLAIDALGQTLTQQGVGLGQVTAGYTAPGLDPDVHAACQHDPDNFDLAVCDLAGLVDPDLQIVNAVGSSRGNVIAYNTQGVVAGFASPLRPRLTLGPERHNFPPTALGQTASRTSLIENAGGADLVVDDVAILQTATPFRLSGLPAFPATLAPGDSLGFVVSFTPDAQGLFPADIVVVSNDPVDPIRSQVAVGIGTASTVPPAISIGDASIEEGADGDANLAVFTVSLDRESDVDVGFGFTTADGTALVTDDDYVATSGTGVIAAGALSVSIEVQVVGDRIEEPDETFTVELLDPQNASIADGTGEATIVDDDSVNRPPVAVDDSGTARQGATLIVNVLANDSDPDGDAIDIVSFRVADDAPLTVISNPGDGTLVVTPQATYSGTFAIDYTIRDGRGGTATATATVTFQPNRPPVAVDDSGTARQGATLIFNVLANDSDPDGDAIDIVSFRVADDAPLTVISNPGDGTLVVTPQATYSGTFAIDYTVRDGRGGTATATLSATFEPDLTPPTVNILSPADGNATGADTVEVNVSGTDDSGAVDVTINGQTTTDNGDGTFAASVPLVAGDNLITATASDAAGNSASRSITITRQQNLPPLPEPDITVEPTSVNFGAVRRGQSVDETIVVRNDGEGPLVVTDIALTGSASLTARLPQAPTLLDRGESIVIGVSFAPQARAQHDASVVILSSDRDEPEVTVALQGRGTAPRISVSSGSAGGLVDDPTIDFGLLNYSVAGEAPVLDVLTIRNSGDADLVVTSIQAVDVAGPVPATLSFGASFPLVVPAQGTVNVEVSLTPEREFSGSLSGFVDITSNDPNRPVARGFFLTDFVPQDVSASVSSIALLLLGIVAAARRNRRGRMDPVASLRL